MDITPLDPITPLSKRTNHSNQGNVMHRSKSLPNLTARSMCAQFVVFSLVSQTMIGCSSPSSDSQDPNTHAEDGSAHEYSFKRLKMTTEFEGTQYSVEMEREGDDFKGTRVVNYPDSSIVTEALSLPAAMLTASTELNTDGDSLIEGLELTRATPIAGGTSYEFVADSGSPITLEIEGGTEYPLPAAAAIILALTPAFIIAVCGAILYRSIDSCADNDRCWSVSIKWYNPASICSGNCRNC